MQRCTHTRLLWILCLSLMARPIAAATISIGEAEGTQYDSILDGYPGFYTEDGVPDAGGNNLAVALKTGATEMRAVMEFPLALLGTAAPSDVLNAKLYFNVDDVLGYLGAPLSGCAAEMIAAWTYAGDEGIQLGDFLQPSGPPRGSVVIGSPCAITDSTLANTGPILFSIDLTSALQQLIGQGASYLGVVLATNTDNTGTSIDDLGLNSQGPKGARGARMPYLQVTLQEPPPPVWSPEARRCQSVLARKATSYATFVAARMQRCFDRALRDQAKGLGLGAAAQFCAAQLSLTNQTSAVSKHAAKATAAVQKACTTVNPNDLGTPCDPTATDFTTIVNCTFSRARDAVQKTLRSNYQPGCSLAQSLNLSTDYPGLCAAN